MIAICIGHSRPGDRGAVSYDGTTEHAFNSRVGRLLVGLLAARGHHATVIDRYEGGTYAAAQQWLARYLGSIGTALAVELHFNAANGQARGFEYLHWENSASGKRLAQAFRNAHRADWPSAPDRGLKPLGRASRGALFCRLPAAPSIILEPFFGDNPDEWDVYSARPELLAATYATAIAAYLTPA